MARLQLIGVDFDSYARDGAIADAATELRHLGLVDRLAFRHDILDWGELITAAPVAERAEGSGLLNEEALLVMVRRLRDAVGFGLREDATPLVYGADCAVLLGALAGARDAVGEVGLVFVDGHEDAFGLEQSPDGQAADSELALALGLTGEAAPDQLREPLGAGRAAGAARPARPAGARRPGGGLAAREARRAALLRERRGAARDRPCRVRPRGGARRCGGRGGPACGQARRAWRSLVATRRLRCARRRSLSGPGLPLARWPFLAGAVRARRSRAWACAAVAASPS